MAPFCEPWRLLREQSNAQSPFFTLPPEIRNRIYEACPYLDVNGICRHIRRETLPAFMNDLTFNFVGLDGSVRKYFTTLPDWAIASIRRLTFDVPISKYFFSRPNCRMSIVIDRSDPFFPWKVLRQFREDPSHYQGKLKGELREYELAEMFYTTCRILLEGMELGDKEKGGVSKEKLVMLMKVLSAAGTVKPVRKGRISKLYMPLKDVLAEE